MYDQLAGIAQVLCGKTGNHSSPDTELRLRLNDCLATLGHGGLIARFTREQTTLRLATPTSRISNEELIGIQGHLDEQIQDLFEKGVSTFDTTIKGIHVIGCAIREETRRKDDNGAVVHKMYLRGYSALCFRKLPDDELVRQSFISVHQSSTSALIFQALQHRVHLFSPFAPQLSEAFWGAACGSSSTPPWDEHDLIRTVTLGYDLRKSTFCMDHVDGLERFAGWVHQMIKILQRIVFHYGGVFDKFTGDGGLVHFLVRPKEERAAIESLVFAAFAMQRATAIHIEHLREYLHLDSALLGAGIGIANGPASWSVDHRYNPVIVGRSVVHACRLMSKAPAGVISVTNRAYRLLSPKLMKQFKEAGYDGKEISRGAKVLVRNASNTTKAAGDTAKIAMRICDEVYAEDAENEKPAWYRRAT